MQTHRFLMLAALVAAFPVLGRETVLEDSPSRLTFEVVVSGYHLETGLNGSRIVSDEYAGMGQTGGPDLPWGSFQIASGAGNPSVSVVPEEWIEYPLPQGLAGVPRWLTNRQPVAFKDATLFAAAGSLAPRVSAIRRYRGMSLRTIDLPLGTYVEGSGRARMLKRFRVQVTFADARSSPDIRVREWLQRAGVMNIQGGQYLTSLPRPAVLLKQARAQFILGNTHLKIRIGDRVVDNFGKDGVYALTYESAVAQAPGLVGVPIQNLRLYAGPKDSLRMGLDSLVPPTLREIPIQVVDKQGDGTFERGDSILFYAHGTSLWNPLPGVTGPIRWQFAADPYSFDNYYYLDWSGTGTGGPLRLSTDTTARITADTFTTAPHYLRAERDLATGSCDPSARFDDETGYDWYWYWKENCPGDQPAMPHVITLTGSQLRSPATDTIKGFAGDTAWLGLFNYRGIADSIYTVWSGGVARNHLSMDPSLFGSWYALPPATNSHLGLDSVQWSGDDHRFEGYTVRYARTLDWDGHDRIVFPAATGRVIAYKIHNGTGLRCLRIEAGVGTRWLPVENVNGYGVFADSAGDGEDVQYFLYSSIQSPDPAAVSLEQIRTDDGVLQGFLTAPNSNGPNGPYPQYLIIAPDALISEAIKLRNYRQASARLLPLTTYVIRTEDIYREWSGGRLSPMAIRDALQWVLKQSWGSQLRYVLLYGDGHYDYRNILNFTRSNPLPNQVPPFNWANPDDASNPMNSDDFYGVLGSSGDWTTGMLDVAVGRLPVQTLEQAQNYSSKIQKYEDPQTAGEWRSRVTLTADDATQRGNGQPGNVDAITNHTTSSEHLGNAILAHEPGTRTAKVYEFDYTANAAGEMPEARQDLETNLNQGALFVNFFGHGAYNQWTDEVLLQTNDALSNLRNANMNFMISAFSCTVGRFDKLKDEGMMEQFVKQKDFCAIAALGASRESYPGPNEELGGYFVKKLFPAEPDSMTVGVGDAVQFGKNSSSFDGTLNKQKYVLLGEPVVVIRRPGPPIQLNPASIPDTLRALQCGTLRGRIPGGSGHGFVSAQIVGGDAIKDYPYNPGVVKRGPVLFERTVEYRDSAFSMDYFLPKQLTFGDTNAKIQFFAWDAEKPMESSLADTGLWIRGIAATSSCSVKDDGRGPRIAVTGCNTRESGGVDFPDNVKISLPYCLQIDVTDSNGGVMSGDGPDEGTTVEVTGIIDPYHPQPGVDDLYHKTYQLTLQNSQMSSGTYLLKVTARDGFGNLGSRQINLETSVDTALAFVKAFNAPNPVKRNGTIFYFSTTLPQEASNDVTASGGLGAGRTDRIRFDLRIFNQIGYMVQEFPDAQSGVRWDGRDAWGRNLANGVYFYQVTATWDQSEGAPGQGQQTSLRNILVLSR